VECVNLPGARRAGRFKGKIEFDKVSFGYADDQINFERFEFRN